MQDASNAGIPMHHVAMLSLAAAVTGACVGYCACRWASHLTADRAADSAAGRAVHQIHSGQPDGCKLEQIDGNKATSQKVDPYDPLPRQGYVPHCLL